MIDYQKLQSVLNEQITFAPEDIAKLFCHLNCSDMAVFFDEIAKVSSKWKGSFAMQMQYVKDSKELTLEGRSIMRTIGEYGND